MKVDYVIVGGGVAGLAAAIRLTELGIQPLVVEAGNYPSHKVCGEFISPNGCELLKQWEITPNPIYKTRLHIENKTSVFTFPKPAGALSHLQLDPQLADRARRGGATILTNTRIEEIEIEPKNLIIATGRYRKESFKCCYYGYKSHFTNLEADCLEMHAFSGGYYGIAPIEEGKFNVASISRSDSPPMEGEWMKASIPNFGVRKTPNWENTYFIGDAAGTIPPATGNGLTMALLSGVMGAEYALKGDVAGFKKAWHRRFSSQIYWGKVAHHILLKPSIAKRMTGLIPILLPKDANSMTILGIGSANPKEFIGQEEALASVLKLLDLDEKQKEHLKNLYTTSGIKKRHMAFSGDFFLRYLQTDPGMGSRNGLYRETAVNLAAESSAKAIASWGGNVADITHVISVSCTGVYAPGIEFSLIDRLKLNSKVLRLGINFMGCFGAFKGLQAARAFAAQNRQARILVVCTELCSLHFQKTTDLDSLLSGSIFADGSAAVIVGSDPSVTEKPLWEITREYCHALKDSEEQMTWEAADTGFRMKLSSFVPLNIAHNIRPFVEHLMRDIDSNDCDYAIHPGGKSILQVLQRKLRLTEGQLDSTNHIFSHFGNMSSATVLFVLEHLHNSGSKKPWCLGLGFGPGLSIEGFLLKRFV